ncbi:MAG: polysaccharide deacetylase family protein [Oligoflexus sp.]|jgi:peptidoglycan/xylan/chitin deacetylase (PgdA/CDA1 family)
MPAAAQELRGRSRWAVLLGLALGLAGCGLAAKSKTCNLKAKGLSGRGWNGQELAGGQLALIFLKGPSSVSADIGAYLEAQSIRAGFFVQGSAVEGQEKVLEEIRDQGHLLGNGSYRYQDLTQAEQPVLELRTTDALITPYVTGNLFLFYAPLKSFDDQTAALLESNGLGKYVGPIKDDSLPSPTFQYDEQCWIEALAPSVCAAQYFTEAQRLGRGVLAFHDTDSRTLVMLQELVPQLKAFGFDLVRLDEIPSVRSALSRAGGQVDQVAGPQACDDYE